MLHEQGLPPNGRRRDTCCEQYGALASGRHDSIMTAAGTVRPVVLCILDGWGHGAPAEDNAISRSATPVWDDLWANSPHSLLEASNADVGLPNGQMGNSEVGHTNIGAGRVVAQSLPRIDQAVADGSLASHPDLTDFIETLRASGGTCHLWGLMSLGGIHSNQRHLAALACAVAAGGVPSVNTVRQLQLKYC